MLVYIAKVPASVILKGLADICIAVVFAHLASATSFVLLVNFVVHVLVQFCYICYFPSCHHYFMSCTHDKLSCLI
jgi:hypothetical protein